MFKEVLSNSEARKELLKGVNIIGDAVKVTLGAKGRNVIIYDKNRLPHITKDGVSVARSINLKSEIQNAGALIIKEVASKTVDVAGDGTTTATVLAQSMINSGIKYIESGSNPIDLKNGIEKTVKDVVETISSLSKTVDDNDTIKKIASISANNDSFIGSLIAEAFLKVGKDGLITVDYSKSHETYVELVEGMKIDKGFISPYFINNDEKSICELINPLILVCDKKISSMRDILQILEQIIKEKREILIICEDLEGEALATIIINKMQGKLPICAIKSPSFGENKKYILEDICKVVGAKLISDQLGVNIERASLDMLGSCDKVLISKDDCLFINGNGDKEEIKKRCLQVRSKIESSTTEHEKDFLQKRLSNLSGLVAIIRVGGITELDINEKRDRIDDSLCATKAAIQEGYVSGGGSSYIFSLSKLNTKYNNEDERIGGLVVKKSLEQPFKQILLNAGLEPLEFLHILLKSDYGLGVNVKNGKVENLINNGVIDPTKVVRCALENASSVASIFLTTECVVFETN